MSVTFQTVKPGARLADQVAATLEAEIRAGRLTEGEKLPTEQSLVQQFGVSRTVVREAVSRLRSLGLVDARQGSGMFVIKPDVEPLKFDPQTSASIEAVLHPAKTNALYMVADGTGGHLFADTLEQHNANVERWYTIRKERGDF